MEPLENIFDVSDLSNINELSSETPIGWSSICLDQTISYYMECNSVNVYDQENTKESNKN